MAWPCLAFSRGSQIPSRSLILEGISALFFVLLLVDEASPERTAACDFTLPPLSFHTSLSHSINYPPLSVAPAASRYSWACEASKGLSNVSVFRVDAHVNVEVSGMLLVAAENSADRDAAGYVFNVEVVMSDPFGISPDAEWNIKSEAMLSYTSITHSSVIQSVQPTLWLQFVTRRCGCVRRLRFMWTSKASAQEEGCEVSVTSREPCEHGACVPFWAYPKSESTCKQQKSHFPLSQIQSPSSTACHPVLWHTVPPPKQALTASFNGKCRYHFMFCARLYRLAMLFYRSFEMHLKFTHCSCQVGEPVRKICSCCPSFAQLNT